MTLFEIRNIYKTSTPDLNVHEMYNLSRALRDRKLFEQNYHQIHIKGFIEDWGRFIGWNPIEGSLTPPPTAMWQDWYGTTTKARTLAEFEKIKQDKEFAAFVRIRGPKVNLVWWLPDTELEKHVSYNYNLWKEQV